MWSDEAQEQSQSIWRAMRASQLALGMCNVLQGLGEWLSAMLGRGPEVPLRITCCPFPSKIYAELRTQTEAIWFACHRDAFQHTTSYLDHCHQRGRLSIWLWFDCKSRPGETEARHVLKISLWQDRRSSWTKNTTQLSRASPVQFWSQKILCLPVYTCIVKTCLKNLPSLSVQTPVLLMHWIFVSYISQAHSIPVVT